MHVALLRAVARPLAVLLLVVAAFAWTAPAASAATAVPAERQANYLWAASNQLRQVYGERSLKPLEPLMARARRWAVHMAQMGRLSHSDITTVTPQWTVVGENVGRSSTVQDVTRRLFASPEHRENILDRRFTDTGVGTIRSNGTLYVVQLFWRG